MTVAWKVFKARTSLTVRNFRTGL
jgi:hypothetical protein